MLCYQRAIKKRSPLVADCIFGDVFFENLGAHHLIAFGGKIWRRARPLERVEPHSKVSEAGCIRSFLFYASLTAKLTATRNARGTDCPLYS